MGSAGITRVLGRRRHPVVTRPPVLGVVRHAGLRAIRRAVGTPERRAHNRATFRKPLPNRCFCECRRQPWRRLAHATTPQRTVNGESDDFSSRARSTLRTDPCSMSNERPPIPFRTVSVAIQRHENAASDLPRGHHHAPRRPQRPSGPALRGFGSREGGTNRVFGGGCQPRRATDVSASETWWSERVRAARARGRERTSAEQSLASTSADWACPQGRVQPPRIPEAPQFRASASSAAAKPGRRCERSM